MLTAFLLVMGATTTGNTLQWLKEVKHTFDCRQTQALDAALGTSYNRRTSLISGSSWTTQSSINKHNVMPLKFNPTALIPLWKYSKQSDCAFSCCTQHCASIWILFLYKSASGKAVWNAKHKDVDRCRSKPLNVCLLLPTHKLYANTSECWLKVFWRFIESASKNQAVCLSLLPHVSVLHKSFKEK